ncbi:MULTISPECIES: metal ABC transporter substrate-binding protein [unclassified Staphylococcus]|uniref:manganese ABC transporter substrate-binding lipoprotein MntC n=1 Tax=unclassified Staphylococcus TaxID=91994 RepID=UPI0021CFED81|nr:MULTISPECIES: metal ABC transporter substrate-binding protein [unclassified Staphylococcus]UXR69889.1 metal ABC transporter substrate-binding protein [Staphylococcus sp. IVB6246]UXR71928.1 metal ABC transporter substrate-binding protein [Staphylococcus sp. IVB6240]UXR74236.1 metal ABC transporter substrate-binding protein [Staphylococcus sp. IVB6238]UXR76625.1 metal ABC transporter substrate-binding protein [Staphylococcus sp. IVB6233]UXR80754.1 metal ABC transporter substrate-binding prote
MIKRILTLCIIALVLTACSFNSNQSHDKVKVVATNSILADMVKNIAGDKAEVHSIVPVGQDPHEYEVKPKDIQALTDADVVVYNGFNLESGNGWFEKALKQADKSLDDASVVRASKSVKPIYLKQGDKSEEMIDPHAWLSIKNGIQYAKNIQQALIKSDDAHKDDYKKQGDAYIKKLETLSEKSQDKFQDIPKNQRAMITSEGAFKYFAQQYDITPGYIWEINTENQGTPQQMKQAIDFVKQHHIKNLLLETSVSDKSMKSLGEETNAEIFGTVYTDSIGKKGSDGDSYYKMMESNIDTIHQSMVQNNK